MTSVHLENLHQLLYAYGNATAIGVINKRRRWDFVGSFHFVGTIVTTIGENTNESDFKKILTKIFDRSDSAENFTEYTRAKMSEGVSLGFA